MLAWGYRKQNLLKELIAYQADILCLQEVLVPAWPANRISHSSLMQYSWVWERLADLSGSKQNSWARAHLLLSALTARHPGQALA